MTTDPRITRSDHLAGEHAGRPDIDCPSCDTPALDRDARQLAAHDDATTTTQEDS